MQLHSRYTKVEIDLKRILKNCEKIIVGSDRFQEPYWLRSYDKFLDAAKIKLSELEKLKTQNTQNGKFDEAIPTKEKIQEYQRKISYLKELKNTDKNILTNDEGLQQTKIIRNKFMSKEEKAIELEARTKVRDFVVSQMKKLITPEGQSIESGESLNTSNDKIEEEESVEKEKHLPSTQQPYDRKKIENKLFSDDIEERIEVTDKMEKLTSDLKDKHLQAHRRIKSDETNVNKMRTLVEGNIDQVDQRNTSLKEMANKKSSLCLYFIILISSLIFIGMFMFIKIFPK